MRDGEILILTNKGGEKRQKKKKPWERAARNSWGKKKGYALVAFKIS